MIKSVKLFNCLSGVSKLVSTYNWRDGDDYHRALMTLENHYPDRFVALRKWERVDSKNIEVFDITAADEQYDAIYQRVSSQYGDAASRHVNGIDIRYLNPR
jgi:hypothetical protein